MKPINTAAVRERIADRVVAAGGICFSKSRREKLAADVLRNRFLMRIEALSIPTPFPVGPSIAI